MANNGVETVSFCSSRRCTERRLNGLLHSVDDKPAIEYEGGDQYWYLHGKLGRESGKPPIIFLHGGDFYPSNRSRQPQGASLQMA